MPAGINLTLSSSVEEADAKHTLSFDIQNGDLQTYQAVITYPGDFAFNGFLALGSAGTQIGSYSFTLTSKTHTSFPIYSISNDQAYGDINLTGTYNSSVDPLIQHTHTGDHVFTITAPNGGDGDPNSHTGQASAAVNSVVNSGIFTNPSTPGTYTVTGKFTSVDPDTGGATNGTGTAPITLSSSKNVQITSAFQVPAVTAWGVALAAGVVGGFLGYRRGKPKISRSSLSA
jgi:hypothetical protein